MRFGFVSLDDMAKVELERIGVKFFKLDSQWVVETEAYDQLEREYQDSNPNYDTREPIPGHLKKQYAAQGTRIWKDPDTGTYYYLIKDVVFKMRPRVFSDYATTPPTQTEISVLEVVDKSDQDRFRDILISRPPNADIANGGVLI